MAEDPAGSARPVGAPDPDVVVVPLDAVRPHPENPRRGDLPVLIDSIRLHGFYGVLVVQASTGYVLAGNHRWLGLGAARDHARNGDAGWERWGPDAFDTVRVHYLDVDDDQALEILLIDNKSSDDSEYDDLRLAAILERVHQRDRFSATGWSGEEFAAVRARMTVPDFAELERRYGNAESVAKVLWPTVSMRVAPDTLARWNAWYVTLPGEDDNERVAALLDRLGAPASGAADADDDE